MSRFLFRLLAAAVLTGGGLVVGAPAASASTGPGGTECASNLRSNTWLAVCFQKTGEIFWLKDNASDGQRVTVDWNLETSSGTRSGTCYDTAGAAVGWTSCNYNFGNGHLVHYFSYTQNGSGGHANHYSLGGTWVTT
jgi:hypothetical protein